MPVERLGGVERLEATTAVLQRARRADPLAGMWEAADVQWWWRRPRDTDALALPVWTDDEGPVAAVGLSEWGDTWQVDAHVVPGTVAVDEVWTATLSAAAEHHDGPLQLIVPDGTEVLALAERDGFVADADDRGGGTTWMAAADRPPVGALDGFTVVNRMAHPGEPHWLAARNGDAVEERLAQTSLYDPTLDLAVLDAEGTVAGYALFWSDPATRVGLLEPMRVLDAYQRRGLTRLLITHGCDRLAAAGAEQLKVGFSAEDARALYTGSGYVQTSVERLLTRAPGA